MTLRARLVQGISARRLVLRVRPARDMCRGARHADTKTAAATGSRFSEMCPVGLLAAAVCGIQRRMSGGQSTCTSGLLSPKRSRSAAQISARLLPCFSPVLMSLYA